MENSASIDLVADSIRHSPPAEEASRIDMRSRWPTYDEDEIDAVVEVLRSGRVNALHHGDRCRLFEERFAALCDMPFAISLANGTLALELALRALGIGPGDEVIVTCRSFVASASCVRTCGAVPVFADVDPQSQNVTAATIAAALTARTRAVIVVHLGGWPCAMDEIMALARAHDLRVIEDCAQAHGATFKGAPVGSFGDAAAFSFCTDKIISTGGEGGMLLLRDRAVWARAWSYKDHGKDWEALAQPGNGTTFQWLHTSIGSNYRMTEMQAAIGLCQLDKLADRVLHRRRNAALLNRTLEGLATLRLTPPPASVEHAYYKYYAFVRPEHLGTGWSRDHILKEAARLGVPCCAGICPEIYLEKAFAAESDAAVSRPRLPVARALGQGSIMLPVDHTLSPAAVQNMGLILKTILLEAES
jgi:dTDP-4-amino-4,6-dideoxygalactose transaminase